jgi:SAM-dependent methyltransferase
MADTDADGRHRRGRLGVGLRSLVHCYRLPSMGSPTPAPLLDWLASLPADARDEALERRLGIRDAFVGASPAGDHLLPYHPSGVAPIVHAALEVPITADDVVIDLGSGAGKVILVTRLLTGATARGVELQAPLVERARRSARDLGIDVSFVEADARAAHIDDGTVFYLYTPFTGPVLAEVLARLHAIATRRAIVVCALGVDLARLAPWLTPRPLDAFWLTLYDSVVPGAAPRPLRETVVSREIAERIARCRD